MKKQPVKTGATDTENGPKAHQNENLAGMFSALQKKTHLILFSDLRLLIEHGDIGAPSRKYSTENYGDMWDHHHQRKQWYQSERSCHQFSGIVSEFW